MMETNTTQNANEWNSRKLADFSSKFLLHTMVAAIILSTIAFTFLGIAFGLITTGAMLVLFRLSFYWEPARQILLKLILLKNTPPFVRSPMAWWGYIFQGIGVLVQLAVIGAGIYMLFKTGFLNQNLIYILFFKLKPQ